MTAKKVTTIPATINKFTAAPVNSRKNEGWRDTQE